MHFLFQNNSRLFIFTFINSLYSETADSGCFWKAVRMLQYISNKQGNKNTLRNNMKCNAFRACYTAAEQWVKSDFTHIALLSFNTLSFTLLALASGQPVSGAEALRCFA